MNIFRCTLGGALFFSVFLPTKSIAQTAPSLREILDSAIVHDYNYANKQLSLESIELDQERLKDVYMPRLDINAKGAYMFSVTDLTTPEFIVPQLQMAIPEHTNTYKVQNFLTTADLQASFVIFAGGKVGYLKKANLERYNAEQALLTSDRTEIIQNVTAVYDQLAMLKEMKKMLDDSDKRLEENLKTAGKALEYGLITQFEYNKVVLAQTQLQSKFKEYEGKRKLVLLSLNMITKIDMQRLALIDNDIDVMTVGYVNEAQNRPELIALAAAVKANEYKVKAAKTWWIPKIGASASFGYAGLLGTTIRSTDPMLFSQQPMDMRLQNVNVFPMTTVGVGVKWSIFDGREGITDTKKARLDLKIAENKQKDAGEKITLQLEKNKIELEVATDQLTVKETALSIAENSMEQATKEFKVGLIKSTQLLEAEGDLQKAKLDHAQAIFQQRRAAIEYLRAAGTLETTTLK